MGDVTGRRTFIKKWSANVMAHELGHNIGLKDAGLDDGTSKTSSLLYVNPTNANDGSTNNGDESTYVVVALSLEAVSVPGMMDEHACCFSQHTSTSPIPLGWLLTSTCC
jgi:hypothetical protein